MTQGHKGEIEAILGGMTCPKGFRCYESGFENLCKAEDIGMESFLVCQEKDLGQCTLILPVGRSHLCRCPLRVYVAKNLKL